MPTPCGALGRKATAERRGLELSATVDACLECVRRLAHRRWSNAVLCGRSAKAAVLGNAEECLDAVERALNCARCSRV